MEYHMSLKGRFKAYPNLKEVFGANADKISYSSAKPHPLTSLVLGEETRTTGVAMRTDKCVQLVKNENEQ